jgi:hypothetical protein
VQERSSDIAGHCGELERTLADAFQGPIDITEEPSGKPWALLLVPPRGVLEIGLGERPNDDPAGHSIQ